MRVLAPGQSRVHAVDWSHHDANKLLSVSAQQTDKSRSGSIKIWDINSPNRVHESIDIADDMPAAARFLPFGPAILASVSSVVVVFSLQGGRKAHVPDNNTFEGHEGVVSAVDFAALGKSEEWRFVSVSNQDRSLRSWKYQLSAELQATIQQRHVESTHSDAWSSLPMARESLEPYRNRAHTTATVQESPQVYYLGNLAKLATQMRMLDCVEEASSFEESKARPSVGDPVRVGERRGIITEDDKGRMPYQITFPDGSSAWEHDDNVQPVQEYRLEVKVRTNNAIRLTITVGIDPSAPAVKRAVDSAMGNIPASSDQPEVAHEKGLRHQVDWNDEWAGTFDGPLAPGIIEDAFSKISINDLLNEGEDLLGCVHSLVRMLERREMPPSFASVTDTTSSFTSEKLSSKLRYMRSW
jgi:hypothetical protein